MVRRAGWEIRRTESIGLPLFAISGVTGEGLPDLLEATWREIAAARARDRAGAIELETRGAEDDGIDLITPARVRRDA